MKNLLLACAVLALSLASAPAAFHAMQIEEVIGGLNGDTSAQAIQLRLKSGGHNFVSGHELWMADAAGTNRIRLIDIPANVSNGAQGARILFATAAFTSLMNLYGPAFAPDFTLTAAIPAAFMAAGRLTFEGNGGTVATPGTIYWSLAWGGASYTGSHLGDTFNDSNGNFGPAFGSALPTGSNQGIRFTGASNANSTTNAADYALTADPATVTRNNGAAFTVVPEPATASFVIVGALALSGLVFSRRRR